MRLSNWPDFFATQTRNQCFYFLVLADMSMLRGGFLRRTLPLLVGPITDLSPLIKEEEEEEY